MPAGLQAVFDTWEMSFQTVHFLLFLPVVVAVFFVLPRRARKGWLLVASYYFYAFAAPKYLPVLVLGTLFTYVAGRLIGAAKTPRGRKVWMWAGVVGCVAALGFFKYSASFFAMVGVNIKDDYYFLSAAAVGISYYTFTAIGYLADVAREEVPAEKNIFNYALFLSFFASVVSGPINRAGDLMPQLINNDAKFSAQNTADALRGMAIGFFKKLAVADTLAVFVKAVFASPQDYTGLTLTLASVGFALQLYFDFSGYSEIALSAAQMLGIKLPKNFENPYYATNFSGFWARWHISLSTWLQDYIFTPLVWSRWTEKLPFFGKRVKKPPVLSAIAAVFLVSGLWHGNTLCFVVWGALQAVFRIGEELLHRFVGKPKKKLPGIARAGKTAVVLVLWVESLVFFGVGMMTKGGTVGTALGMLGRQFLSFSPRQAAADVYASVLGGMFPNPLFAGLFIVFMLGCLALALWADWAQWFKLKGESMVLGLQRMKAAPRWILYFVLVLGCFAGFLMQSGGFGGASFMYANF